MQRRAAAIYVAFFVLVAVGAFTLTTVAQAPSVSVEGQNYSQGDAISAAGTEWTINIAEGAGNVTTVNESARFTASIANNSSLLFVNGTYRPAPNGTGGGAGTDTGSPSPAATGTPATSAPTGPAAGNDSGTRLRVLIPNTTAGNASDGNVSAGNASGNISSFTLRQQFVTGMRLRADPSVADVTLTGENGTQYVRYRNGSTQTLDEYLPEPAVRNVSMGDSFPYQNNSTTVAAVNTSGVTLAWEGRLTRSQEFEDGANVTLGGTTYVAQFPTNSTVTLSQNVSGYQAEQADLVRFENRVLGLWGVVIISLFAAALIAILAYMPVRG